MDTNSYNIRECRKKKVKVDINEILDLVNEEYKMCSKEDDDVFTDIARKQILYDQQFLKKELEMIADYYCISKRKKNK